MTALPELREQAIALRRAGKSRREIMEILQVRSSRLLTEALRGEPPLLSSRRPNAKDDLRAKARELRVQGLDYNAIAAELNVSKSSVSLWVRDLPRPERLRGEEYQKRRKAAMATYWEGERARRATARNAIRMAAKTQIGSPDDRDILIAGAIAYWCEGAKSKPHRACDRVIFTNSDPHLIRLFLRFLDLVGVARDRLIFRVSIHETADITAAQDFWLDVTQAPNDQFRRPSIKRHNPKSVRLNTGETYRGCLRVVVRRSIDLYTQMEGWFEGIATNEPANSQPDLAELPGEDSNLG
jgi:hypothetical protein